MSDRLRTMLYMRTGKKNHIGDTLAWVQSADWCLLTILSFGESLRSSYNLLKYNAEFLFQNLSKRIMLNSCISGYKILDDAFVVVVVAARNIDSHSMCLY